MQQGVSFFERNRTNLQNTATGLMRARTQANDAMNAMARAQGRTAPNVRNSTSTLGRLTRPARIGGSLFGFANNVRRLPGQGMTAFSDWRRALQTGNAADRIRAERSTRAAASNYSTIVDTAAAARRNARAATFAVQRVAQQRLPILSARVGAAANQIAESSAGRLAQRVIANPAARNVASMGARTLGRFATGANVIVAAADINEARRVLADPNSNAGQRVTSVVTAFGSAVAATNIPVVSQVGAVVSTISSAIGWLFS
ncbi:MAG: hypothetical protein JNM17_20950 [Archangium sp.]|nr:hypothetical protein [Archangium sp.]